MVELLSTLLIISVVILACLIGLFLFITFKEKKSKDGKKEGDISIEIKSSTESKTKLATNIVQTKTYTTDSVKNFMEFKEIKDNMIILNDEKKYIMVVQCKGVNYDLMSSLEKSAVEQGFSQFLNTLTKPIQIYIQSRKVNLEESIERYNKRLEIIANNFNKAKTQLDQAQKSSNITTQKLKEIRLEYTRQKNLYEYTKDIIANTEKLSLNQSVLTKNYYIAISYRVEESNFLFEKDELMEMAFSELYTNAQAILRTLSGCGVTGKVLNSIELAELLYVAYNRDASETYDVDKAIKAGYDALYTTAPDVVTKKIEQLDKMIDEKAFQLASDAIKKAEVKSRKEKELKQKEKNMDKLIKEMAQTMILETKGYLPNDVITESIKEINNPEEQKETKKKKTKKGA